MPLTSSLQLRCSVPPSYLKVQVVISDSLQENIQLTQTVKEQVILSLEGSSGLRTLQSDLVLPRMEADFFCEVGTINLQTAAPFICNDSA